SPKVAGRPPGGVNRRYLALIWKRAVVRSRVPMSKYMGWYSEIAPRKASNAVGWAWNWLRAASAGAGPASGWAPVAVTAATGTGSPVLASTTGPWAGALASVPLSRPDTSSAIMVG